MTCGMAKLGRNQLKLLFGLANPGMLLVVGDGRVPQSLVKRGYLTPKGGGEKTSFLHITPTGMRALADAFEAGALAQFMKPFPAHSSEDQKR